MNYLFILIVLIAGCATNIPSQQSSISTLLDNENHLVNENQEPLFIWPLNEFKLTQEFKPSGKKKHHGIDLSAPKGSLIHAAHEGRVLYTGRAYRGYGKLIIIEKDSEWATVYSHCHQIFVKDGERVLQGQVVASVGRTGRATGPHLHFELRKNKFPINPISYLLYQKNVASNLEIISNKKNNR